MTFAPLHQFITPLLPPNMRLQTGYMDDGRVARYKLCGKHVDTDLVFRDAWLGFEVLIAVYPKYTDCPIVLRKFDCCLGDLMTKVNDAMRCVSVIAQAAVAKDIGYDAQGVLA